MNLPSRNLLFALILLGLTALAGLTPAHAAMEDYPVVKLQSLDKITARTKTFEVRVGSTVKYGPLFIKVQACRKAPPIEQPESAAFLQIWEVTHEDKAKWVFSGWMFASSPALSPMDHPIYDVWVIDCLGEPAKDESRTGEESGAESQNSVGDESENAGDETETAPGNSQE